jgi:hypothetical protein
MMESFDWYRFNEKTGWEVCLSISDVSNMSPTYRALDIEISPT